MLEKRTTRIAATILSSIVMLSSDMSIARESGKSEIQHSPISSIVAPLLPTVAQMPLQLAMTEARETFTATNSWLLSALSQANAATKPVAVARKSETKVSPDDTVRTGAIPKSAGQIPVFDSVSFSMKKLGALAKFAPSLDQIRKGTAFACTGSKCSGAIGTISNTVERNSSASLRDKLNIVNSVVNKSIRYQRDYDIYKVADRWAKPSETMALGKGDCEDFAILKMAALQAMGVPADSMGLVVVYDQRRSVYHAVLAVAAENRYFILDNVRNAVLADRQLPDYMPLYSIVNGRGFFHGIKVNASRQVAKLRSFEMIAPGEGPENPTF